MESSGAIHRSGKIGYSLKTQLCPTLPEELPGFSGHLERYLVLRCLALLFSLLRYTASSLSKMTILLLSFLFLSSLVSIMAAAEPAGCKIRITDKGLEMCKYLDVQPQKAV
ncbi:hypothetical protein GOODEAATRI_028917 [Goodea atripinnis]|uniref:Uncharacterized protein n=1 Tax=Goodea atripinnis TaxID=208336 RepID=A0ABV0P8L5_9TELE